MVSLFGIFWVKGTVSTAIVIVFIVAVPVIGVAFIVTADVLVVAPGRAGVKILPSLLLREQLLSLLLLRKKLIRTTLYSLLSLLGVGVIRARLLLTTRVLLLLMLLLLLHRVAKTRRGAAELLILPSRAIAMIV